MQFTKYFLDLFVSEIGVEGGVQTYFDLWGFLALSEESEMKHWWKWDARDRDEETIIVFNYFTYKPLFRYSVYKACPNFRQSRD